MSEVEVEPELTKLDKAKEVVRKNWKPFTVGAVLTGVALIATKRVNLITRYQVPMFAKKIVIKDSVLLIETYAREMGPPSWIVECLETGEKFTSQAEACRVMGLSPADLSQHLNGMREHVKNFHFRRLAMAIPNPG